ncbi:hypothetical protein SDC9_207356 [bioreactor metagenome]|uniref:Uncharacterized protein n=1 Tax=bioreactor metagenome TaxID=1076179 RepID=A0A645J7E3_9ZZZZ
MAVGAHWGGGQDFSPAGGQQGADVVGVRYAGFDRDGRWIVAGEVRGVDVEAADLTAGAQLD